MTHQHSHLRRTATGLLLAMTPIAAAAASLLAAGPASAARIHELDDGQSVAVDYADLNLAGPAGARTLLSRIRAASSLVCHAAAPATPMNLGRVQGYRSCLNATIGRAVDSLDAPVVTALYANQFPGEPTPPR